MIREVCRERAAAPVREEWGTRDVVCAQATYSVVRGEYRNTVDIRLTLVRWDKDRVVRGAALKESMRTSSAQHHN